MLLISLEWIIFLIMVPVVAVRQKPTSALAWLILIFFQPWIGLLLYLSFGDNLIMRLRLRSACRRLAELKALDFLAIQQPHIFSSLKDPSRLELAELAQSLVCMPTLRGNSVELLDDGWCFIDRLIEDIDGAAHHVHLLFYIFEDDPIGRRVAEAMARAAQRGVRCRILVDDFGSRSLRRSLGRWLVSKGIELHSLMPLNPFRRHLTRLDLRNHRKLAIFDGAIAYTGSQNIENRHYSGKQLGTWHDIMVRICGPAVLQMQLVFQEDWFLATERELAGPELFPVPHASGDVPIQVVLTGPIHPRPALRDLIIAALAGARNQVTITSPYFIPDEPLLVALQMAASRNVRVDLILPRQTDHPILGSVARAYFDSLIEAGVRIYLHRNILHAKTMSVDDTVAFIGTANFDVRSFHLHSEVCLLLYGLKTIESLRKIQAQYLKQSVEIDPRRWKKRSNLKRMRDHTLKLLSPIL